MTELKHYGLIRASKKTGKIDTTMTALGSGLLNLWALQNTTSSKVTVIVNIDDRCTEREYHGTKDGFPRILKSEDEFEINIPYDIYAVLDEDIAKEGANV